ncbi:PAS domain-containing protein [Ectothiorhodospiraceae bacterium 2226]|nr:PAS domain-containing protein [Ectothiorhodospiraceae bacterium 2226]
MSEIGNESAEAVEGAAPDATSPDTPAPQPSTNVPAAPFVVAIGASAGGLEAQRALLARLDQEVGAAFIVVQHMAPHHRSMLAELLARDSRMEVREAVDGEALKVNVLYVTPPNYDIVLRDGRLRLLDLHDRIGPKPSIDRCFSSMAEELGPRCGGIILSGTGSDGAQGARAIRAAGGFVIAQDPTTAKYDSMPRAAINTGVVDLVLAPGDIAAQLGGILEHLRQNRLDDLTEAPDADEPFRRILDRLKQHSQVDFALYKPNTLHRRIQRRMNANRIKSLPDYLKFVDENDAEVKRLFQDVLISATSFFRDQEQYESLREALRRTLPHRGLDTPVRVWSAGCATGEEPYSLAIMLLELLDELKLNLDIQIFATDIDEEAMSAARRGIYSETSLENMPKALVTRYFEKLDGVYQIKRLVRERVVFSRHDLTRDPPFLRMDLISCRNVFIYFSGALQERIIKLFHYALSPNGLLFLGKAESLGSTKAYFRPVDNKLYQRSDRPVDPEISFSSLPLERSARRAAERFHQARATQEQLLALIRAFAPDSLVLDEDLMVREIYGNARQYLRFPEGTVTHSVERLLADDIKNKIVTLLHRAKRSRRMALGTHLEMACADGRRIVQPRVYPVQIQDAGRLVLSFDALPSTPQHAPTSAGEPAGTGEIEELERELAATREHLQTVIQEQETANEELQALNEELHSANEELQSTNEELETSNEELQSTNEELTTLNEELNIKSNELLDMNNYLHAVQDATQYPILMVDKNLNLVDFNRGAEKLLEVHPHHKGKSVHLIPNKDSLRDALAAIERSLHDDRPQTVAVQSEQYDLEVTCRPIRGHTGRVDGVVASFMDYTAIAASLRRAEASERTLATIFENVPAVLTVKDASGRYTYVNDHFARALGRDKEQIIGNTDRDLFDTHTADLMHKRDLEVLSALRARSYEERVPYPGGARMKLATRFPLVEGEHDTSHALCTIAVDITERVEAHRTLKLFHDVIAASNQTILIFNRGRGRQGYRADFISHAFGSTFNAPEVDLHGASLRDVLAAAFGDTQADALTTRLARAGGGPIEVEARGEQTRYFEIRATHHPRGRRPARHLILVIVESTERRAQETQIRSKQEEVLKTARLASLGEMAAGIAHELNTPLNTIQNYVDLIRKTRVEGKLHPEYTDKAIDAIEDTVARISEIVVGLRSFARVDSNHDTRPCDVIALIRDVITMCDFHLRNKGVRLEFDPAREALPVRCHPTQLSQVFVNLINNAIDAVRNLEDKWIRIEIEEEDDTAVVRVIDSGGGISGKIAAMVMTPFFTTKEEGTGLGLSLARSIMKAHRGDLRVDTQHHNTCFELTIPKVGRKDGAASE